MEEWKKSSYSNGNGSCVECAPGDDGGTLVRDSKDKTGPVLSFTRAEWVAFVKGARDGEFDEAGLTG